MIKSELSALKRALGSPLQMGVAPLGIALIYAVPFAAQNLFSALLAQGVVWAGPVALVFMTIAFAGFVVVLASYTRTALSPESPFRVSFGRDERLLGWVFLLVFVLSVTILGTGLIALSFMLAAL